MRTIALLPRPLRHWLRARTLQCGVPRCPRFAVVHPWLRRPPGIFLHAEWSCSPECLRDALSVRLSQDAPPASSFLRRAVRLPFRLILFERGLLTSAQLEQAWEARNASDPPEELGDTLLRLGFVSEEELASARAHEAGCGVYSGVGESILPSHLLLPASLMRAYKVVCLRHVPVKDSPGRLFLGFAYRINHLLVKAMEEISGCQVEACMLTRSLYGSLYQEQLSQLGKGPVTEAVPLCACDPESILSSIVQEAVHSGADSMCMARVGHVLWARLAGTTWNRNIDLVFDLADVPILEPAARPIRRRASVAP